MSIPLYMDHNVPRSIVNGLRARGVHVITAYEDGMSEEDDSTLLDRATELGCALFTRDFDLLQEAAKRQRYHLKFGGVIFAHQLKVSIGTCIRDLELIAKAGNPKDIENETIFLPL